ncbi:MAG: zinc ribbon domain-containing protein [Candidatus Limimorpha sp.]
MEKEIKYCQSCGMPLINECEIGCNTDGSKNNDYCKYCFDNGHFLQDCTMEEMIQHCVQFIDEFNKDSEHKVTREEAIAQMRVVFPHLKRWKSDRDE